MQETVDRLQLKNEFLLRNIEKFKGDKDRDTNSSINNNQTSSPSHRKNSSIATSANLAGAFNKKYIEKEFTSIEFNKPRQMNNPIKTNNNLQSSKNVFEYYEANDKFDSIFNNIKAAGPKSNRNLNKK